MEKFPQSSSEYLKKNLETRKGSVDPFFNDSILKLRETLFDADYYEDGGNIEFNEGGLQIKFSYEGVSDKKEIFDEMMEREKELNKEEDVKEINKKADKIKEYLLQQKLVKEFVIKNGDKELNLLEICPPKYKNRIFFKPNTLYSNGGFVSEVMVVFEGDIATPDTLLSLLHEIGHSYVYDIRDEKENEESLENLGKYKNMEKGADLMAVLKEERDAWAFALRNIKPFLKSLKIDTNDIKALIHDFCLRGYSRGIEKRLELFGGLESVDIRNLPEAEKQKIEDGVEDLSKKIEKEIK